MGKKTPIERFDANAFRHGTQNVPLDAALEEVDAAFEARREEESRKATDTIKHLEAETNTFTGRKADANERWQRMNSFTEGREPEVIKPLLAVLVAFGLLIADGQLLAPVMDGLNIAEPIAQLIVATVLVMAFSLLLKISVHNYRQPQRRLWLVIVPAAFSIVALGIFGWWRGTEVVFASLQTADLGNTFAADNPTLTKLFVTLATIALPVGAALSLEYGLERLRLAYEWRKSRSDSQKFSKRLDRSQKRLEAAKEKRDHEREKLAQIRDEWLNAARQSHAEGQRVGAHREPLARVLFKTVMVGILIIVVVLVASYVIVDNWLAAYIVSDLGRLTLYLLAAFGIAGWYAERQLRRWDRPTAEELYQRRKTHWHNVPRTGESRFGSAPAADAIGSPNGDAANDKDQLWLPVTNHDGHHSEVKFDEREQ